MVTTTLHWWCHSRRSVTGCWQTVLHSGDCRDTDTGNTPGTPCHGKHRQHLVTASPPEPDNNVGMTAVWRGLCCRCHARCVRLCPECRLRSDSRAEYRLLWTEESDSPPPHTDCSHRHRPTISTREANTENDFSSYWFVNSTLIIHCSLIRSNQYFYFTLVNLAFILFMFLLHTIFVAYYIYVCR